MEVIQRHALSSAAPSHAAQGAAAPSGVLRVRDAMRGPPVLCTEDSPLERAARALSDHRIPSLPVRVGGHGTGDGPGEWRMVGDLDVLDGLLDEGHKALTELPGQPAVLVTPEQPLREAAELMVFHRAAQLLVVTADGERPLGVLSSSDVLRVGWPELRDAAWVTQAELAELSREECIQLLGSHDLGRLIVAVPGRRAIVRPVNYTYREGSILVRTGHGAKLTALRAGGEATFEIDELQPWGWSVIVHGVAKVIDRPAEISRLGTSGHSAAAPGVKDHWLSISVRTISGRRILPMRSR